MAILQMTVASLSTVGIPVPAVARVAPHSLGVLLFGPLPSEHYFLTSRGGSTPLSVSSLNLVIPQTGLQPAFSTSLGFLPPPLPLLPHLAGLSRNSVSSYKDLHIADQINNVSYRNGRPRRPYVPCHVLLNQRHVSAGSISNWFITMSRFGSSALKLYTPVFDFNFLPPHPGCSSLQRAPYFSLLLVSLHLVCFAPFSTLYYPRSRLPPARIYRLLPGYSRLRFFASFPLTSPGNPHWSQSA